MKRRSVCNGHYGESHWDDEGIWYFQYDSIPKWLFATHLVHTPDGLVEFDILFNRIILRRRYYGK